MNTHVFKLFPDLGMEKCLVIFVSFVIAMFFFAKSGFVPNSLVFSGEEQFQLPNSGGFENVETLCGATSQVEASIESIPYEGNVNLPVGDGIAGLNKWSENSTWNLGNQPTTDDNVFIPSNSVLVLDKDIDVKSIIIEGKLIVDLSKDISIAAEYIWVKGANGYFEWGTDNNPYNKEGILTLKGSNKNTKIPGTLVNYKAIMVSGNGVLELHGSEKTSWTRLGSNAAANQNRITVASANTGWGVGDEVLIVSSRIDWNEAEKRTITAASLDKRTFTLNSNLRYPHIGVKKSYSRSTDGKIWDAEIRAEVGLLSKSIKIQGDASSAESQFGGHIMVHGSGVTHVENIELFRMGQKAILGRYPFHWHLQEGRGVGQYLKNSSIHLSYNRAITIHGTESVLVEGNFAYDHIGHGLFLEDGSERFNIIKNNVMVLSKRPTVGDELTPSDNQMNEVQNRTPSQYWITNPNNVFEGNVAAGTAGTGFWFAMPQKPMGFSRDLQRFSDLQPHRERLGVFRSNTSHSCKSGFDIFDQLDANHRIIRNAGWLRTDKRYIDKHIFYANDLGNYGGIGNGRVYTENVVFRDNIYSDNKTAIMHANYCTIENSLFVANSGQNIFTGERKLNRGYDGACTLKDCHLVGWDSSNANYVQNTGGAQKHVNYRIEGLTLSPDKSVRMNFPNYSTIPQGGVGANASAHPRFWSYVHWDIDGSLTGKANTSIITNHPLCRDGSEVRYANWTNLFRTDRRFAYMLAIAAGKPKMTLTRTKEGTPKAGQYYVNDDTGIGTKANGFYGTFIHFPVIVNDGFLYTMQFETLGTGKRVTIHMKDAYVANDEVLYKVKDFGMLPGLSVSNAASLNTLEQVINSNVSAWVKVGDDVYLKMVAKSNTPDISCAITWTTNITLPILDTDGDGISDYEESKSGTDPVGNGIIPPAEVIEWEETTATLNNNPVGAFVSTIDSVLLEGYSSFYVKVDATDPDGDNIELDLKLDGQSVRSTTEKEAPYEWGKEGAFPDEMLGMSPGVHELSCDITDSRGAFVTITKQVLVIERKGAFNGFPTAIPGVLEMEEYDKGGSDVSYFDSSEGNNGQEIRFDDVDIGSGGTGYVVGWTAADEWLEYTIDVSETALYQVIFHVASKNGGGKLSLVIDGESILSNSTVPKTNEWSSYTTYNESISLREGVHVLRVLINTGGFNIDKMVVEKLNVTAVESVDLGNLSIYPNPSYRGVFYMDMIVKWEVFSVSGHMLAQGESDFVDISTQSIGVYWLKINGQLHKIIIP